MSEPFVGEIRMVGFTYAPDGWLLCHGQSLAVSQWRDLYAVIGCRFGGNNQDYFNLPDLSGRVPIHAGAGRTLGETGGSEAVTLTAEQTRHTHGVRGSSRNASSETPLNALPAVAGQNIYGPPANLGAMDPEAVTAVGGGGAHYNMQPYLCINFIIAARGLPPPKP